MITFSRRVVRTLLVPAISVGSQYALAAALPHRPIDGINSALHFSMNFLQRIFDIRSTANPHNAMRSIAENIPIRGYNMWLLMCAAVLASIGLDTNSTAVIIGAMLISPLMSPILGVGLSLGIHDQSLLIRSLRNLGIATVLSLLMSFLYFSVSPVANPTSELASRTAPTLLDVMIALFGGIAGIVSASRAGASNAIPGVAIATALMPPLCTAGYGLATQRWHFLAGAFYLFFINAVFISLATFLIVKLLRFPVHVFASRRATQRYAAGFTILIVLVTLPNIYFLFTVYQNERIRKSLERLVLAPIQRHGNDIIKWEQQRADSGWIVKVYYSGHPIDDSLQATIRQGLVRNDLPTCQLRLQRVNLTRDEIQALSTDAARQLYQQMQVSAGPNGPYRSDSLVQSAQLQAEVVAAFPEVDSLKMAWLLQQNTYDLVDSIAACFVATSRRTPRHFARRLQDFLKVRLKRDTVVLLPAASPALGL